MRSGGEGRGSGRGLVFFLDSRGFAPAQAGKLRDGLPTWAAPRPWQSLRNVPTGGRGVPTGEKGRATPKERRTAGGSIFDAVVFGHAANDLGHMLAG
jgi:hypothetical protein